MKLISLVVLINFLALGALAQDLPNQVPADAAEKLRRQGSPKACQLACEITQDSERRTCREESSECFSQALDLTLDYYRDRSETCASIADSTARRSCRMAALGWAVSQAADARQVCTVNRDSCLNDADDRATACGAACAQPTAP